MGKKYQDSAVAFIDILGFKDMVTKSVKGKADFYRILDSLGVMKTRKKKSKRERRTDMNPVSIFSDSIVISYCMESKKDSLLNLLEDVVNVQNDLLEYDVLCRGGIAVGPLYHSENKVFGPAMNHAYELESKAIFPRVVLEKNTLCDCICASVKNSEPNMLKKPFDEYLLQDENEEDILYVDYLHKYFRDLPIKYKEHIEMIISDGLENNKGNGTILEKYKWLEKYWNKSD